MKNHISFCVNNSKRLTFCFVNELQDVLRFLYYCRNTGICGTEPGIAKEKESINKIFLLFFYI